MSKYVPPQYKIRVFNCPYCNVCAEQHWRHLIPYDESRKSYASVPMSIEQMEMQASFCSYCGNPTLWLAEKIIYPPFYTSPPVNSDLPDNVQSIYEEAAAIANQSPRAACALLRLAIEMLLKHLGETGTINEMIKNLVKQGLDEKIQQALDIVRVTGNNAVHPGEIDLNESANAQTLFGLINLIADSLITQPKRVQGIYENLPEDARKAIEKRDDKTK